MSAGDKSGGRATQRITHVARRWVGLAVQPIGTLALALAIGVALVILIGQDPISAYRNLVFGSFDSVEHFGNLLSAATPILIAGLGVVVSFRAGIFNVGGDGQIYVGAILAAAVGFTFVQVPGPLLIIAMLVVGALAGAVWSGIAGVLKAYLEVDEVVATIMLNYIAMLLTQYLVTNPWRDPATSAPSSPPVAPQARWGLILAPSTAHFGLVLALILVVAVWFLMFRTEWGIRLRAVGTNRSFAEAIGVNPRVVMVEAMLVAGALAGIAGADEVLGVEHRFYQGFDANYGFLGLVVALLGRLNPLGMTIMAFLYAALLNGAAVMQINTNVPYPLVSILAGIVVVLLTSERSPIRWAGLVRAARHLA